MQTKNRMKLLFGCFCGVLSALMIATPAFAVTVQWNTTSGNWGTATNWFEPASATRREPTALDNALISTSSASNTVIVTMLGEVAKKLDVGGGAIGVGSLNIQAGGQLMLGDVPASSYPGSVGLGISDTNNTFSSDTLHVKNGSAVTNVNDAVLASVPSSKGIATVTGAGSSWTCAGALHAGWEGNATLKILDGATISNGLGLIGLTPNATGVVTVNGAGSSWNNSGLLQVGDNGNGTLHIQAGGAVSSTEGTIAWGAGSTSTVNVNGTGSNWNNTGDLQVGEHGNGTLNIQTGGAVSNVKGSIGWGSGSTGTANVSGAGSEWTNSGNLQVGENGAGTLDIESGGLVSDVVGIIAGYAGSTGTATVTGVDSSWSNSSYMIVGSVGNGTLNIQNRGTVTNSVASISDSAGSSGTVTVTGVGSTWNNSSEVRVGNSSIGYLYIQDGGRVNNSRGILGHNAGSNGTATITGAGSTWDNISTVTVGREGAGTVNIQPGGTVHAKQNIVFGQVATAGGTVNLEGGTLDLHGTNITKGAGTAAFNFTGGTLKNVGIFNIGATLVQDGGALAPGASPGTTQVVGDYDLNAGSIEIELAGLLQGTEHDFVEVTGALNLGSGSTLNVVLVGSFVPALDDSFDILDFASVTGSFNAVNLPALDAGLTWDTSNLLIDGSVFVVNEPGPCGGGRPLGDANGDLIVDLSDVPVFTSILLDPTNATAGELCAADVNEDGGVNGLDTQAFVELLLAP